ncbi:hypothetical protein [Tenacibaculum aiptasiae]|uniref:hypothetical protein n=1 Tax=Tenacibaculum aiptasiae TaxID=426481 RepID=UPI003B5A62F0
MKNTTTLLITIAIIWSLTIAYRPSTFTLGHYRYFSKIGFEEVFSNNKLIGFKKVFKFSLFSRCDTRVINEIDYIKKNKKIY